MEGGAVVVVPDIVVVLVVVVDNVLASPLDKNTAPEALGCCVQTCLLGPIAPTTPLDCFIHKKGAKINNRGPGAYHGGPGVYPYDPDLDIGIYT